MKLFIAATTVVALANGIAALPWTSNHRASSGEEITIHLNVDKSGASAGQQQWHGTSTDDVCWRVCFFEKPQCPEGMYAKAFGDCWTCCLST